MVDLQRPVTATPATPPRPDSRLRSRVRSTFVAALSAAVLLAGGVYVLAPADASVRLRVDETVTAQPFDAVAIAHYTLAATHRPLHKPLPRKKKRAAYTEVVYGKVDARGVPVSRITLRLKGVDRATRGKGVIVPIRRANVAYRVVLHLKPGKYRYSLSLRVGNRTRSATVTRLLRNKHYYRVSVKVRPSGLVTFLPVTSY